VQGRDPDRWRYDAANNLVIKSLRGCAGPFCHEYDHILPYSKGGHTTIRNCQVLQTHVNRYKSNKIELSIEEMKKHSIHTKISSKNHKL
jgi:5-methylcytosine-specific restriction endonuclease McrA